MARDEHVVIWAARSLVPEFLDALLLAGLVAAALSSASTFLSLVGFSIGNDINRAKTRITLLASLGLIVYGVAAPLLLLKYYVIPYQIGTGQISPDGSVNWNTGEALITLTIFMLPVPLALMAMKVIRDRYDPRSNRNQKILCRALLKEKT